MSSLYVTNVSSYGRERDLPHTLAKSSSKLAQQLHVCSA
jgi:hypothetical protein